MEPAPSAAVKLGQMIFRPTLFALALALAWAAPVLAEPAPAASSLELGVGVVVLTVPDYRGSDRYDVQAYPVPYAVYHSDHVQLSREGLRARIFSTERLSLSISGALNLTGRRDNPDRAGMPQLAPTLEIGPSLDYRLDEGERWSLRARLPVRATISSDGFQWVGAVVAPHLRYDYDQKLGGSNLFYLASLGGTWASSEYHQYYYGVAPQYAVNPSRPAYDAPSGYSGARATLSATWRLGKWRVGAFASNDWLEGVAFDASPLLKTRDNLAGGLFVTCRLYARGREWVREDDT